MTINLIARCVFATLLSAFSFHNSFAQVFWTETFSDPDAATTFWVNGGSNDGSETWKWSNDPAIATFNHPGFTAPTASDGFFLFDSDANGEYFHNISLTGPSIDCSSSSNTRITFCAQYMYFTAPDAMLEVSNDGGVSWASHMLFETLALEAMFNGSVTVDIPEANGQNDVRLRFRWEGHWEYSWKLDDIKLENYVPPSFCDQNPTAIMCDDLDAYNPALYLGPQSDHWTTWFGAEGGGFDATVSTEQASTVPSSIKIVSTSPGGGPQSAILQLGGISTGQYELKFKVYVPSGKTAYYDMRQAIPIVLGGNNLNVYFDSTGTGILRNSSSAELGTFSFPNGEWFECKHIFDLDNDTEGFWVDGIFITETPFTGNLGGVLFMGPNAISVYYVDDVAIAPYEPVVFTVDDCEGAISLNAFLGGAPGVPQTTGIYDNTNATASPSDPPAPECFFDGVPAVVPTINGSLWYNLTGDGNKYHIETVPCNATNYIGDGDTQMAIYTGECGSFTELLCNEDLAGAVDFRAGLDVETVSGLNYHLLIDGWSDQFGSYVATGEFCIEITNLLIINCNEATIGSTLVGNNGFVCDNNNTGELFNLNQDSFVLPNVGLIHGFVWAITSAPVPAGMWPPSLSSYWGSYAIIPEVYSPNLINDGSQLIQDTTWYFTPVIIGDAIDASAQTPAYLHDLMDACYIVGESIPLHLLSELAPLEVTSVMTPATFGENDGSIALTISGGALDILEDSVSSYSVVWNGPNGFTSNEEVITGLVSGTYNVTVTDVTGCVKSVVAMVEVSSSSSTKDPANVKSLTICPNPTTDVTVLKMALVSNADVRIDVLNTLGQILQTINAGNLKLLNQQMDMTSFANGTYFLRIRIDNETTLRRVVVIRQ